MDLNVVEPQLPKLDVTGRMVFGISHLFSAVCSFVFRMFRGFTVPAL